MIGEHRRGYDILLHPFTVGNPGDSGHPRTQLTAITYRPAPQARICALLVPDPMHRHSLDEWDSGMDELAKTGIEVTALKLRVGDRRYDTRDLEHVCSQYTKTPGNRWLAALHGTAAEAYARLRKPPATAGLILLAATQYPEAPGDGRTPVLAFIPSFDDILGTVRKGRHIAAANLRRHRELRLAYATHENASALVRGGDHWCFTQPSYARAAFSRIAEFGRKIADVAGTHLRLVTGDQLAS